MKVKVSLQFARSVGDELGVDWDQVDLRQFQKGLVVEQEHEGTIRLLGKSKSDRAFWLTVGSIALDHLSEFRDYYTRLEAVEKAAPNYEVKWGKKWPGYYDLKPGTPYSEVVRRWAEEEDKPYDNSMPQLFYTWELWSHREYTWSRGRARRSVEEWDELEASMRERGFNPGDPVIVFVGRDGSSKVGEGNHRLAIAKSIGIEQVPARFVFYDGHVSKRSQY